MKRSYAVAAAIVVTAAAAATGGALLTSRTGRATEAGTSTRPNTVQVLDKPLSAMVSQGGILTYRAGPDGSPYSVINQAEGTYTKLAEAGQVISSGEVLYRVDNRPVVLLQGSTPAYRDMSAGTSGPDVAELNADLIALGYATAAALTPTTASSYGPATTTAVVKLQASVGAVRTGTLKRGQAVFEPVALRVTSLSVQPGSIAQIGQAVLEATSTARQVQVALSASEQTEAAIGDKVSITLPDNRVVPGTVSSVATVATCPSSSGSGGSSSGATTAGAGSCSVGGAGSAPPVINVTVTPADPTGTGKWDQAPVQVGITTQTVPSALVVPVAALLAQAGGSYAVEVASAGTTNRLVPVSLGLFDDASGLVQVTAAGLAAGQDVVVPAL